MKPSEMTIEQLAEYSKREYLCLVAAIESIDGHEEKSYRQKMMRGHLDHLYQMTKHLIETTEDQ